MVVTATTMFAAGSNYSSDPNYNLNVRACLDSTERKCSIIDNNRSKAAKQKPLCRQAGRQSE